MDIDPARIERIQGGDLPFCEPGLNELVQAGIAQVTARLGADRSYHRIVGPVFQT